MDDCKTCLQRAIFTVSLQCSVQAFIGVLAIANVNWRTKFGEPGLNSSYMII